MLVRELEAGVSHLSLVPTQLGDLLEAWGERPGPRTLRAVLLGGMAAPPALLARARQSGFPVLTTYGMTETASGVAVGGAEPATLAEPAAFRALPGVRLRIETAEAGDPTDSGAIEIAGPMVFSGYVDDAAATAERLHAGWLHSSDLGTIDERGLLRVLGRSDDAFISGGENVQPDEVEAVLRDVPGILDAAVLGEPDPRWGRVPLAAIVVAAGARIDDDEVRERCRERLAAFKVPRRILRLDALPRGGSGKLLRRELAEQLGVRAP
jgi:O-succinylbenzoic acid--CoA ligase